MRIDLTKPAPQVKTLEQAQALIELLWQMLREQAEQMERQAKRIDELEEKLRTNSRNSSKPPSTDQGRNTAPPLRAKSGKKAGGQPGHAGKARALLPPEQVTQTHDCHPAPTCACGGAVKMGYLSGRHQVIDLPDITPQVTEYRLYAGICQTCGQHHEASLPASVSARVVGPRLLALMGTLSGGYRMSKRLVQGLLQDVFHIDLSVGTISNSEALVSEALAPIVQEAHAYTMQAPVVHADETGHRQQGQRQWMWVAIAGVVSVFMARASRSAAVARELLGACFAGIVVSDRYGGYGWLDVQRRQLCWAHLLRDFTKMAERGAEAGAIGAALLDHAHRMFGFWSGVRDGSLCREGFATHMLFLRAQIEAALRRGSACGDTKTARTCNNLLADKKALWTFVDTPGIEPTNNLAERTLRSYVIWRKISFGTQSQRGSLYVERVMTVVGSCKLQGRNILDFITQAVRARAANAPAPSLVPTAPG